MLVAVTTMQATTGQVQLGVTIGAGQLVVVAADIYSAAGAVTSISDSGGNNYAQAITTSSTTDTCQIWYAANTSPGSALQVTLNTGTGAGIWVPQFSGVAASPLDGTGFSQGTTTATTAGASVTASVVQDVVVVVAGLETGAVTGVAAPFTELTAIMGDGAAYTIVAQSGVIGPSWSVAAPFGSFCAASAAFRPAAQ